jgi:hypothetical protein
VTTGKRLIDSSDPSSRRPLQKRKFEEEGMRLLTGGIIPTIGRQKTFRNSTLGNPLETIKSSLLLPIISERQKRRIAKCD